ncbi:PEGA domain-containing protein [Candidatus Peregrinibacteria bacterium]|nr:PEGA domain-containing protein [Candidatus Peregrinibacteria bacterium]
MFSLFITYGYRYDFDEKEVVQTSVIDVCTIPKEADLYLDEEFYSDKSCQKIYGLDLGAHELSIQKEGYYTWNKSLYLNSEQVSLYPFVFLIPFPEFYPKVVLDENVGNILISPNQSLYATYDEVLDVVKIYSASRIAPYIIEAPAYIQDLMWVDNSRLIADTTEGRYLVNVQKGEWNLVNDIILHTPTSSNKLIVDGNEIWIDYGETKKFITRYSENIVSAQYFYNEYNLLITTNEDVRICDTDGENCHVVTKKDSGTPIANPPRSKKIVFVKDGVLTQITLAKPTI